MGQHSLTLSIKSSSVHGYEVYRHFCCHCKTHAFATPEGTYGTYMLVFRMFWVRRTPVAERLVKWHCNETHIAKILRLDCARNLFQSLPGSSQSPPLHSIYLAWTSLHARKSLSPKPLNPKPLNSFLTLDLLAART